MNAYTMSTPHTGWAKLNGANAVSFVVVKHVLENFDLTSKITVHLRTLWIIKIKYFSTSGVCIWCLASNGTNLYGMIMYEANEATQTHCYNPVTPVYPIWAYYAHGWQCRCQEDPVSLPSGRLEKTTRSSPHHIAQHRLTGSETTPPYAPRSSRFGSEPPSVEDDVDVWCYAIVSCMPEMTTARERYKC